MGNAIRMFLVCTLLSACSTAPDGAAVGVGVDRGAASTPSGYTTQGRTLQGRTLQGRTLQGRTLQGTALAGATVQGTAVQGLTLQGTSFAGTVNGQPLQGTDFIGAVFQEVLPDGSISDLQVLDIAPDPTDTTGQVLLYSLWSVNPVTGVGGAACAPDASGDTRAVPLSGVWSESGAWSGSTTSFSFGCVMGVLSKCLRWGYHPWESINGTGLRNYHQTCTRLARADYCGDGTSYTQDGTLIDIYDDLGVQVRAPHETLLFDAAWTPNGAQCISKERWITLQNVLSLNCQLRFVNLLVLLPEISPVANNDVCLLKRADLVPSAVHIDNRSALNIELNLSL